MSNLGRWNPWYKGIKPESSPRPYGTTETYRLGAEWLKDCSLVEDWGCGMGWMQNFIPKERYRGIDGTKSPFVDVVCDLFQYRSYVPGIYMRGVIEHEPRWKTVLANAVASFEKRMCLVLFTPMVEKTKQIKWIEELGVPDISFSLDDLSPFFYDLKIQWEDVKSDTGYGGERIFYLEK